MSDLGESQRALLKTLKQQGPLSAKALAESLAMTTMGARQHLAHLADLGFVDQTEERPQARGRPVRCWQLTRAGHDTFGDRHNQLMVDIIASVRDTFGEEGLDKLIDQRSAETQAHYQKQLDTCKSVPQKLKKLAELRSAEGYMATVEAEGKKAWLLIENHCPICDAAKACQNFCRSELEIFQKLFKGLAEVSREDHIIHGARRCAYKVRAL